MRGRGVYRPKEKIINTKIIEEINFTKNEIVIIINEKRYTVIGTKIDDYGVDIVFNELEGNPYIEFNTTYEDIVTLFNAVFNLEWDWDKGIAVKKK